MGGPTSSAWLTGEERFRQLVESAPLGILICDAAGDLTTINRKALDLMGSEFPGFSRSVNLLSFPPLIEAGIAGDVAACLSTGEPVVNERRCVSQSKGEIFLRYDLAPVPDADGMVGMQGIIEDVTDRKRSEVALQQREEQFLALAEAASAAICILQDGRFQYTNPAMESITGYSKEALQSIDFRSLVHADSLESVKESYDGWLGGDDVEASYELKGIRKDGEVRWAYVNRKTIDYGGRPALLLSGIDITERKRAEESLRLNGETYRKLVEEIGEWICEVDENFICTYSSPRVADVLGYAPRDIVGRSAFDFMPPSEVRRVMTLARSRSDITKGFNLVECTLLRKDGRLITVEISGTPIFDSKGAVICNRGVIRDVSARKQAENALLESEERLRLCIATAHLGTLDWDPVSDRHVWSPEIYEIFGLPSETRLTLGQVTSMVYPGDRLDDVFAAGMDPAGNGEFAMEYRIIRASDGDIRWVHQSMRVIFKGEGEARHAVRVLGVVQDITGHKQAEAALRESEEKFRALAETTRAGILLYRNEWFIYVNPVLVEISGYPREELLRMKFWDLVHPDHREVIRDRGLARQRGQAVPSHYEAKIITRDGTEKWLEFSAGLINYDGEPAGIATLYDITERKRAEEAVAEAKATAELYLDLMGHDINNMNQISMGFMEMARHRMEVAGKLTMDDVYLVDKAIESVRNSSHLIRNVRKLQRAKLGLYEPEVLDLGKMLRGVADKHRDVPGRHVRIDCELKTGCYVKANELLEDVFINLVGNAIKHSRGPLDINIRLEETHIGDLACWKVVIDDNGPGIPDGQKETLFNRLNLSVSRARGKGFGLCLIKLLIDGYGGEFWVEDRVPGDHTKGARFVVVLPVVTAGKP
jgi:PAS domain S-box-containing protein